MRSYGQYCSIAKALDVIGDRWNLLIVRELLMRGPCRYTDLLEGLPGIATNLLADRLRELERLGILVREDAPPPVATALFSPTERGRALWPVLLELGRWGAPLMTERGADTTFRSNWLALPVQLFLSDQASDSGPVAIEVRTQGETAVVEVVDGELTTRPGSHENPDVTLSGAPELVIGLVGGRLSVEAASSAGLELSGDLDALRRLLPRRHAAAPAASAA
jgi:DNA-binding HxlR family transcriptional regulator